MDKRPYTLKVLAGSLLFLAGMNQVVKAGSFSLYTESRPAAIGNYAAGIAAEAADASTGWYNPAGLVMLPGAEVVLGGVLVDPRAVVGGTSIYQTPFVPSYIQHFPDTNSGKEAFVPSFHAAYPLGENATFGLSVVSPFGLTTNWSSTGPVRYAATKSKLLTVDVSPELGVRMTEHLAFGAGIDFQYADVWFNSMLGSPALLQAIGQPPSLFDTSSYNHGHSFALGFHAGLLLVLNDTHTRFGVNYQSQVDHQFHGYSQLTGVLASPTLTNSQASFWSPSLSSNVIGLPQIVTVSAYQDVNAQWALQGSVVYTGWSSLQTLGLNEVAAFVPTIGQALVDVSSPLHYKDVWRVAVGANYEWGPGVLIRGGVGYDKTPTVDAFRDVRIADTNRFALAVGGHYQVKPSIGFDLGYSHLFSTGRKPINEVVHQGTSTYYINGSATGSADLVGLQLNWDMA